MKEDKNGISKMAMILSVLLLIVAALVSVFNINLWLAGTQWILISILVAVYGIYMRKCNCDCCKKE